MSQFITSTPLSNMRPIGSPAERTLPRIQAVLDREFPDGIGLTLAEPVHRRDGAGIDWYIESDDRLTRLTDLPQETADLYRARLKTIAATVRRAASTQETRNDAAGRSTASALRNAVTFPGDANVWIAGDPTGGKGGIVITAWGHGGPAGGVSGRTEIATTGRDPAAGLAGPATAAAAGAAAADAVAAEIPVETAATVAVERSPWWRYALLVLLTLLPVALAAWTAWILLPACGARLPFGMTIFGWGGGTYCALEHPQLDAANRKSQQLLAEVAMLKEQVQRHALTCVPPPPPRPPAPTPSQSMDQALKKANVDPGDPNMVTLWWHNHADLDLHLVCPDHTEVNYQRQTSCNAQLNVDRNRAGTPLADNPVENITWGQRPVPPGHYRVYVELFKRNDVTDQKIQFSVRVKRRGKPDKVINNQEIGGLGKDENVVEFDVP